MSGAGPGGASAGRRREGGGGSPGASRARTRGAGGRPGRPSGMTRQRSLPALPRLLAEAPTRLWGPGSPRPETCAPRAVPRAAARLERGSRLVSCVAAWALAPPWGIEWGSRRRLAALVGSRGSARLRGGRPPGLERARLRERAAVSSPDSGLQRRSLPFLWPRGSPAQSGPGGWGRRSQTSGSSPLRGHPCWSLGARGRNTPHAIPAGPSEPPGPPELVSGVGGGTRTPP